MAENPYESPATGEAVSPLPGYVASATPNPLTNRVSWFSSTAQTYAGIMLWFVFWQDVPTAEGAPGGTLAAGLGVALAGLVLAALLCHFLYYLVPGLLGMKTGLPLYIVGTSTYGTQGGFLMPGFLMGLLQFGWLGVNACFSAAFLVKPFYPKLELLEVIGTPPHVVVVVVWAAAAAFMGLKGIQYVAKVATFLPLIPLTILVILFVGSASGIGKFDPAASVAAAASEADPLTSWGVIAMMSTYVIGFFATAGAAGCDFGMNNRDTKDVQLGGLFGVAGATVFAGGLGLLIVAGAHGSGASGNLAQMNPTQLMDGILSGLFGKDNGPTAAAVFMYLLAIAAFPPACFSSFIAANSFKTTLPKVNPFITVGIGTLVAIVLAGTGVAKNVVDVFKIIGASFGPICGAMAADYLLSGRKWAGPRAGFNLAGWVSWLAGFSLGAFGLVVKQFDPASPLVDAIPIPPLTALVVGFVLYAVLAKAGLQTKTLPMPQRIDDKDSAAA
jgi:cytosine permease